jgi:uncharacterized Zn-binding protein involved in type VI secretion
MPAAVRLGDICSGHGSCSPRPNVGASKNVFINTIGAHRVGDPWSVHCTHSSVQATGSNNVFVNNISLARIGDLVACGSTNASGSNNVFVNNS